MKARRAECAVRSVRCGMRAAACVVVALLAVMVTAVSSAAQTTEGRVDVGGGLRWVGATTFGEVDATETSLGGQHLTLFKSRSQLESSPGVEARVGVRLIPFLHVEAAAAYNSTRLRTDITADFEGAETVNVTESIRQFIVEGGLLVPLAKFGRRRVVPFASGGAGYLRQLHDGQTYVQTGASYYAGGGVNIMLRTSGGRRIKGSGIRGDVRALYLRKGIALDHGTHAVPSLGASLFVRF